MQQEGFQLSYDLSQAANLIEDAIPYLVITEVDIWKHVAGRLPLTPKNLYSLILDNFAEIRDVSEKGVILFGRDTKLDRPSFLHENEIHTSLLEKVKMALTTYNSIMNNRFRGLICWQ